jgi:hypothetical protein
MAVTPEFVNSVAEALDELGYSVETEQDVIDDVSELNDDVTLPGIRQTGGAMTGYVSMKLAVLYAYLQGRFQAIQTVWNTWFGIDTATGVQGEWQILKVDVQTATTNANAATASATTATQGAERVNAGLQGFTVTITDRNGTSRSVDIGFEIYRTYPSIAAMNADAANVPQGKFVVIATTSATDPDNAKMYCKTSQGTFSFMCDLDQASSAAWADWLNNMKPQIEAAISTAASDHTTAGTDHSASVTATAAANTAASNANQKATLAGNEADRAKNMNDHPPYIGADDYWYLWDYDNQQYVRGEYARGPAATIAVGSTSTLDPDQQATVKNTGTEGAAVFNFGIPRGQKGEDGQKGDKGDKGDDLDYSTMTPEEKSELNDTIVQHIVNDNILGPTYDEVDHGFDFPPAMHVQWDAENHGFDI